jgi:hypothetical protein
MCNKAVPIYWEITNCKYNIQMWEVFGINFSSALVDEHTQQILFVHTRIYAVVFCVKGPLHTAYVRCTAYADM